MPSLLVTATGQALVLGAASNILAQIISAQQENRPFAFDGQIFAFFLVFTLISCPPNVLWQIALEDKFPANDIDDKGQKTFSKTNTVKKFVLDQTISASLNTIGYIAALSAYQGNDTAGILNDIQKDFWPLMRAGWKVWPMVALLSFTVIPLEKRTLFGSTVGLFWGIYMSLLATDKAK